MGWFSRIFGNKEEEKEQQAKQEVPVEYQTQQIPPERIGLYGQYDQSGLAKRVVQAFDEHPDLDDIETLWVAQTGATVVLKGKAPADLLPVMAGVARGVDGTQNVDYSQVEKL